MVIKERIISYIAKHSGVTDADLMAVATKAGYTEAEIYTALEQVGKDKRIATKVSDDSIVYTLRVTRPVKDPSSHLTWGRDTYPPLIAGVNDASHEAFAGVDYSWMFLKTKEERDAFIAKMKGQHIWGHKKTTYSAKR